ncbi:hypothetical protein [Streptomyces gardneri]|uniref:hypothetical protein n=1 Tax=Streptomyces gardneri TaxID=66892 RepID=UPI00340CFA23
MRSYDQKTWVWNTELALGSINLKVDIAGPNVLYVRTVNKAGNISAPTTYLFYVRPRPGVDKPGDVTGDGFPDILAIDGAGNLRTYAGDATGDTDAWLPGAVDGDKPVAGGYWKDASGKPALISHSTDWFPGDGITDLIARMPDGKLYVYPGDGAGRFDMPAAWRSCSRQALGTLPPSPRSSPPRTPPATACRTPLRVPETPSGPSPDTREAASPRQS